MDTNELEKDIRTAIFAAGVFVTLRLIWQRKFNPLSEAILVAIILFVVVGIGYFIVVPSGTPAGMWLSIAVGEIVGLYWSLTTHPRRRHA
jgi:hypothetical protein